MKTRTNLDSTKARLEAGSSLQLDGSLFIQHAEYIPDPSRGFNVNSLVDKGYVDS